MQQRESNDLDVNVGDKIKKIMKAAGMSQRMLARAAGVSNSSISRICAGANNIEMGTLIKICKALNKEPAELWHSGGNKMCDLKPCPFCGGKAITFQIPENTEEETQMHPKWQWNNPGMWVVGCDEDPLCMGNYNHVTMLFITKEQAISTWNRRAESKGVADIMWQYCHDPNVINKAMDKHDENWEGLTSAEQIISITYDTNHGCYVVFWRRKQ